MWKVLSGIETLNPVILSAESLELMERKYALRPYKVESILDVETVTRVARTKTYILILEYKTYISCTGHIAKTKRDGREMLHAHNHITRLHRHSGQSRELGPIHQCPITHRACQFVTCTHSTPRPSLIMFSKPTGPLPGKPL